MQSIITIKYLQWKKNRSVVVILSLTKKLIDYWSGFWMIFFSQITNWFRELKQREIVSLLGFLFLIFKDLVFMTIAVVRSNYRILDFVTVRFYWWVLGNKQAWNKKRFYYLSLLFMTQWFIVNVRSGSINYRIFLSVQDLRLCIKYKWVSKIINIVTSSNNAIQIFQNSFDIKICLNFKIWSN